MNRRPRLLIASTLWLGFALTPMAAPSSAQTTQPAATPPATPPTTQPAGKAKPLPGPKYERNRADDDFSYLDGPPGTYQPDFFDPIKRIHLADHLTLRLGGEARGRLESVTHRRFGTNEGRGRDQYPTQDTYFLHRYYYHADLQYGKLARVFVEGLSAWIEDRQLTSVATPTDRFDVHQMFADLRFLGEAVPLTLRFGRQELSYGTERLIGMSDWTNVKRTWDGVKVFWAGEKLSLDAFYVHPVEIRPRRPDWYDEDLDFYGAYTTYQFIKKHGIDAYFLGLHNDGDVANANVLSRDVGDVSNYTLGSRLWGQDPLGPGIIDYENELAGQWGKADGDTIQAWLWSLYGGYTHPKWPWQPRFGFGVDYGSGDHDPGDDIHQTWNPLFPTAHRYLGILDSIGRQNLWSQNVNLTLKPTDHVTSQLAWYVYSLAHTRDALYSKSGNVIRRIVDGDTGAYVGNELDFTLTWQLNPHASLLFGYAHLWTSENFFSDLNRPKENPDLIYFQYLFKF